MPKPTLEEMVSKVKKFGRILSQAVAGNRELRKQEQVAITAAMRIQAMHPEKFAKKLKKLKKQAKTPDL